MSCYVLHLGLEVFDLINSSFGDDENRFSHIKLLQYA
jgi:hypothetical protein